MADEHSITYKRISPLRFPRKSFSTATTVHDSHPRCLNPRERLWGFHSGPNAPYTEVTCSSRHRKRDTTNEPAFNRAKTVMQRNTATVWLMFNQPDNRFAN